MKFSEAAKTAAAKASNAWVPEQYANMIQVKMSDVFMEGGVFENVAPMVIYGKPKYAEIANESDDGTHWEPVINKKGEVIMKYTAYMPVHVAPGIPGKPAYDALLVTIDQTVTDMRLIGDAFPGDSVVDDIAVLEIDGVKSEHDITVWTARELLDGSMRVIPQKKKYGSKEYDAFAITDAN